MIVDFLAFSITWAELTSLIQAIIWPLTVLLGLLFFRKHLGKVISSLGSIKAGASGFEMNFQSALDDAQIKIGGGSGSGKAKTAGHINFEGSDSGTPYEQLLSIRDALNSKIIQIAQKYKIPVENISSQKLCIRLLEGNYISRQNARNFNVLLKLTNSGSPEINQSQVDQVKALYNNLQL